MLVEENRHGYRSVVHGRGAPGWFPLHEHTSTERRDSTGAAGVVIVILPAPW